MTTAKKTTTRSRKTTATRKRSTTATKKPRTVTVKKKTLPPNPMVYEILEAVDSEKVKAKKVRYSPHSWRRFFQNGYDMEL